MGSQSFKFKSETKKVLDLVTHSLYSSQDVFLRELISNASDAIDKARFESIKGEKILEESEGEGKWKIRIFLDKQRKVLRLQDNGIGMNEKDLEENLGTIASSGTEKFMKLLEKKEKGKEELDLIGQFGVGFYSAFMVADKIEVKTRKAEEPGVIWRSQGGDAYDIEVGELGFYRGTEVCLWLKEGSAGYLEEEKVRQLVKSYSNYIEFPVVLEVEKEGSLKDIHGNKIKRKEEEVLNSQKAIWMRSKEELKDEEYEEFYKYLSHDMEGPMKWVHYKVEGLTEFSSILYIPKKKAMSLYFKEIVKNNIHLYVKRVFIMKECEELLPNYLRFVTGVVDSTDLPLNVSRDTLQEHRLIRTIKKSLVKKVLQMLKGLREKEMLEYKGFYKDFSAFIKEGVYEDMENRTELLELLLYQSTKTTGDEYIGLREYVDRMAGGQKHIYYISGEEKEEVKKASHLEIFQAKGYEVLYCVEPMDEIMFQGVTEYQGKVLKSILKGNIDLNPRKAEEIKEYKDFNIYIQEVLSENIKEVKISERLTKSPCCLVSEEGQLSEYMLKLMKVHQQNIPKSKQVLEINIEHPLIQKMHSLYAVNKEDEKLKDYIELIYAEAVILEGGKLSDPLRFTEKMNDFILNKK